MLIDKLFSRATAPQPQGRRSIISPALQAGIRVNEDTALTYSAVWACVNYISGSIAALPWHLFEKLSGTNKQQIGGQIDWMLSTAANDEAGSFSFRETMLAWALLWGNGIAEIETDLAGRPVAMWPIEPDRVKIDRDTSGKLVYIIANHRQADTELNPSQVFHLHGLGWDGISGYSVVSYAARSIGLGVAAEEFGSSFFGNGTQLGLALEHPNKLSQQAKDSIVNTINEKLRGPKKAFGVMVFEEGMKVAKTNMPMTDAQFLETRKFQTTEIARWFRVPPHKIADLDRSTNNNIEHQGIEAIVDCLLPWVVRLEQEANLKLCKNFRGRRFTKMNLNGLLRGDIKARGVFYKSMHSIGALSTNDILELEDRNTIGTEGDKRLVQLNQTTLDKIGEELPAETVSDGPDNQDQEQTQAAFRGLISSVVSSLSNRQALRIADAKDRLKDRADLAKWADGFLDKELGYMTARLLPTVTAASTINGVPMVNHSGLFDALGQHLAARRLSIFNDDATANDEDLVNAIMHSIYQEVV